jgi:hypothetical protein
MKITAWILAVSVTAATCGWVAARIRYARAISSISRQEAELAAIEAEYRKVKIPAEGRAEYVSGEALSVSPERYDGKRLILEGIWTAGFEQSSLRLPNASSSMSIWVTVEHDKVNERMGNLSKDTEPGDEPRMRQTKAEAYAQAWMGVQTWIVAEGTFRFKKPTMMLGYGHLGVANAHFLIDRFLRIHRELPNQALEPTPTAVTSPAAQEPRPP